jgi:hypothetical protein
MNTVEKTSTGVTPADLILSHSIRLTSHIDSSDTSFSDRMDEWISRQHTLKRVNFRGISIKSINLYVLYTPSMGRGKKVTSQT